MVTVSIIIPNWNGQDMLEKCLASVFKQDFDDFEVILVDNASKDGSVGMVKKRFPAVKIIQNSENFGFAKGCNIGVAKAKGRYWVLLNNDSVVDRKWLVEMLKVIKSDKRIKGVGSLAYNRYGGEDYVFAGHGSSTFFFQNVLNSRIPKDIKTPVDFLGPGGGSCMYENDGVLPFDDDYFMYGEDTYHGVRCRLEGFTHKMVPTSIFYHEGEASSKKIWSKKIYFQERNRWLNVLIIYSPWTLFRLAPLAAVNITSTVFYDPGNALTRIRAYLWIITHPLEVLRKRRKMQSCRRVKDAEILKFVSCKFYEEYLVPNKAQKKLVLALNKVQCAYCRIVGIKTMEFYEWIDGKVR
ncbi:MAG: glycosyltransferase family 2 protein [Nanoarchaeota archaeon]